MRRVVGIGTGLETTVDVGYGSRSGDRRYSTRVLLRYHLCASIPDRLVQAWVDELRVVFVLHLLVYEGRIFGLLRRKGLEEEQLSGNKYSQEYGRDDGNIWPRIEWFQWEE